MHGKLLIAMLLAGLVVVSQVCAAPSALSEEELRDAIDNIIDKEGHQNADQLAFDTNEEDDEDDEDALALEMDEEDDDQDFAEMQDGAEHEAALGKRSPRWRWRSVGRIYRRVRRVPWRRIWIARVVRRVRFPWGKR